MNSCRTSAAQSVDRTSGLKISGTTALVTGAGRRIGRALALALADQGARVAVHFNSSERDALETAEAVRAIGAEADIFQAELSDSRQVAELADRVAERFGGFQVLVNNASAFGAERLEALTVDEWDFYMAANVRAPFQLAQAMLKALPGDGQGKIINLNDWRTARANRFAYGVSKAALTGLTGSLAVAMAPRVQVNQLALGAILPPADIPLDRPPEDIETNLGPAGRMGTLNEVADAMIALIANDFITGETVHVDGGRHIR